MNEQKRARCQRLMLAFLLAFSSGLASDWCQLAAEARYLPTRSDDAPIQALKDLIRGIISQARANEPTRHPSPAAWDRMYANEQAPLYQTPKVWQSQQRQQQDQAASVQRRNPETAIYAANDNDGYQPENLMLSRLVPKRSGDE